MTSRQRLLIAASCAFLTLAGGEWLARHATRAEPAAQIDWRRSEQVTLLSKDPQRLPDKWSDGPSVLLIGNSHTYALPGLERGQPLRPDPGATLIDELAGRLTERYPETHFYRLAYPNFQSLEMLARMAQLQRDGLQPTLVVLGLTFRNLARGAETRHQIRELFRQDGFAEYLDRQLRQTQHEPATQVLETVADERRRAAAAIEQERLRSAADRFDLQLSQAVGNGLHLAGSSAELRSKVYRRIAVTIDDLLVREEGIDYVYGVVDRDLRYNLASLRTLLEMLRQSGSRVLIYQAPERDDLPLLIDPSRQNQVMSNLQAELNQLEMPLLDARQVVPNPYWGWVHNTPDRSHFTEPGHQRLAEFLVRQGHQVGFWQALEAAPGADSEPPGEPVP